MGYSRRRRSRRSTRGGTNFALSPALLGGRRRSRRGGSHNPLNPAPVDELSASGDGAGITKGVMGQTPTAGGYRSRRSRRRR